MIEREASSQPTAQAGAGRWRRRLVLGAVTLVALGLLAFGRGIAAWGAQWAAGRHIQTGAFGPAQQWLAWADWLDPDAYATDLLQAACLRHLGEQDPWRKAMESAERNGAPIERLNRERKLGELHWGQAERIRPATFNALTRDGAPPREAATALVYGLLTKGRPKEAQDLLDDWTPDPADKPQAIFLEGVLVWSLDDQELAESKFESALAAQPRHEMARAELARLLEQQYRLDEALAHYAKLANAAPERETVKLALPRVLRKLGRLADARSLLGPLPSSENVSRSMAVERAELEYESGDYAQAKRWFEQADLEGAHLAETLRTAATVYALNGDAPDAEQLFTRVDEAQDRSRHVGELQRRLALDRTDAVAAEELQRLAARGLKADAAPAAGDSATVATSPLYVQHCAACHGEDGRGDGRAARYLFPRPRDLRAGPYRLIGTTNGVPMLEDLERVIQHGIPGASMPSFARLPEDQRKQLAEQVRRFHQEGVREQLLAAARAEGETVAKDELDRAVAARTTPSDILPVPSIGPADAQAVARGRELYVQTGCGQCHGDDGRGDSGLPLFDDEGQPVIPRDLARDPMKGGPEPESLYRRLRLGMPGTPHPASATLSEEELIALVQYCRSLSEEPKRTLTNFQRAQRAAHRALDH